MSFKITAKTLQAIALALGIVSLEIFLSANAINVARAQPSEFLAPVSEASIAEAKHLSKLGKIHVEYQNYREAIAYFSKAIQLNPNEADFYYQRGLILRELSDRQAAIQDFDDAILRNPKHAQAYLQRAGLLFNFQSDYEFTDYRGFTYRITNRSRGDARAMLDLRTARDLFAQQGDQEGFQTAEQLIRHFAGSSESKPGQQF